MPPTKLTSEQQADLLVDKIYKAKDALGRIMKRHELHALLVPYMPNYVPPNSGGLTAEDVYAVYPRKIGRKNALLAITKAVKRGASLEQLLKAVQAYSAAIATWAKADRQYVPYPSTWFNRDSHEDDPAEWMRDIRLPGKTKDYSSL